jgi:hypothetical protein
LRGCDGFRVEGPRGLIGWVEETWLGPDDETGGFAVRLLDGRRGFVPAESVSASLPEREEIVLADGTRILELGPPRLERALGGDGAVTAAWTTTGELLAPPEPLGLLRETMVSHRRWRLAPPPAADREAPLWQALAALLSGLALLIALEITVAFTVAYLVTGHAY